MSSGRSWRTACSQARCGGSSIPCPYAGREPPGCSGTNHYVLRDDILWTLRPLIQTAAFLSKLFLLLSPVSNFPGFKIFTFIYSVRPLFTIGIDFLNCWIDDLFRRCCDYLLLSFELWLLFLNALEPYSKKHNLPLKENPIFERLSSFISMSAFSKKTLKCGKSAEVMATAPPAPAPRWRIFQLNTIESLPYCILFRAR